MLKIIQVVELQENCKLALCENGEVWVGFSTELGYAIKTEWEKLMPICN